MTRKNKNCKGNSGGFHLYNYGFLKRLVYQFLFFATFSACLHTGRTENGKDIHLTVINKCSRSLDIDNADSEFFHGRINAGNENWTFNGMDQILKFNLTTYKPNCTFGEIMINLTRTSDGSILSANDYYFKNLTAQGELTWRDPNGYFHSSLPHSYCIDLDPVNETSTMTFMVCKSGCTAQEPCVRKCCHPNQIVDLDSRSCVDTTKLWKPFFYSAVNHRVEEEPSYTITYGFPTCKEKYIIQLFKTSQENHKGEHILKESSNKLNLLPSGSLVQINGKSTILSHSSSQFCIDGYPYHSESKKGKANYSGSEWDQVAIICAPTPPTKLFMNVQNFNRYLKATLLTLSAVCLLLTDIVYLILWKHKNIHEWLQFSCATSFFFAFGTLAVVIIMGADEIRSISEDLCKILGSLIHFSFLTAFFWMTSMNFDLWFRFSGCRPLRIRSQPTGDKKRFLFFALFSLGFPFLFAFIAATMDYIYWDNPEDAPIPIPKFGRKACYFSDKRVEFPYAKGPELILFLVNIIFFVSTVVYLRRYQQNTELARTNSNAEDRRGKFRLFSKLFIVMGVLWIFEFISWAVEVSFEENQILNILLFLLTDSLNCLQGVAIFVIYVCKANVYNLLKATLVGDSPKGSATPPTTKATLKPS